MLRLLSLIGPGLLLAATGVGAGDLATGAFAGAKLGTAVLWAVALGALLKFSLNEGLARLQLASGQTIFVAVSQRLGRWPLILFLPYLLLWSYFVGAALISAWPATPQALSVDVRCARPRSRRRHHHSLCGGIHPTTAATAVAAIASVASVATSATAVPSSDNTAAASTLQQHCPSDRVWYWPVRPLSSSPDVSRDHGRS